MRIDETQQRRFTGREKLDYFSTEFFKEVMWQLCAKPLSDQSSPYNLQLYTHLIYIDTDNIVEFSVNQCLLPGLKFSALS